MEPTYFLRTAWDSEWAEVTKNQFICAERDAGFYPKSGKEDECATGGFGSAFGVSGRIIYNEEEIKMSKKSLGNTDVNGAKKNVSDLVVYGDGDLFKLLSKASSQNEGWMKSTKAMEIEGVGCVVQVTTQQGKHVAEALTFVPGVRIEESVLDEDTDIAVSRKLVAI
jgi:hypothetical protein